VREFTTGDGVVRYIVEHRARADLVHQYKAPSLRWKIEDILQAHSTKSRDPFWNIILGGQSVGNTSSGMRSFR
jgi:hypothetical protein